MKKIFVTLLSLIATITLFAQDGPYVLHRSDGGVEVITYNKEGVATSKVLKNRSDVKRLRVTTQEGGYSFEVKLHDIKTPAARYDTPEKIAVMSDPHGDMVPFVETLREMGVMDKNFKWSFGRNHLVVLGDVADRGDDVTAIYWLIYKLEAEAAKAGGMVHFTLGNHEVMIAQSDFRYVQPKYKELPLKEYWSSDAELGRWINSRNQVEKIGDVLFVHAGISTQIADSNLSIEQINDTVRKYILLDRSATKSSPDAEMVMRTNGTLWYRGLVKEDEHMNKKELNKILDRFGVKRIVVGHTMLSEVSFFHDNKVIDVNVNNTKNMKSGGSRGIIIQPRAITIVYGAPILHDIE